MSELNATNCGCDCDNNGIFGGDNCCFLILILLLCGGCGNRRSGMGGCGCGNDSCIFIILILLFCGGFGSGRYGCDCDNGCGNIGCGC